VWDELRSVFSDRGNLLDSMIPAVAFVVINGSFGLRPAILSAVGLGAALGAFRVVRRQPLRYAMAGLAGALVASAVALLVDRARGYFLPSLLTGGLTVLACVASVLVRRPLVGWTSHVARRWPRAWYWHPQVRPAYSEVTLIWALFFAARVAIQVALLSGEHSVLAGVASVVAGWPATILLLIGSYLFGTRRLRALGGPSVEEFRDGVPPPWQGQRRGF
jgi:hypothetical protein